MSFGKTIKKNLDKIVLIGIPVVAILIGGISVLSSFVSYKAYESEYDKTISETAAKYAALPKEVFIDNKYVTYSGTDVSRTKSSYTNSVVLVADPEDVTVAPLNASQAETYVDIVDDNFTKAISGLYRKGGAISFSVEATTHGLADIEIAMMTNWFDNAKTYYGLDNITDYIKIQINKLNVVTVDLELSDSREEFTSLILKDTNLVEGTNTLTITTSAYNDLDSTGSENLYVMPDIRNVTFISEASIDKVSKD